MADEIVNLKEHDELIHQYVDLRNKYSELLLTSPVNVEETRQWLKRDDIEVVGIISGGVLTGASVLYLSRHNEIAFFAADRGKGIGSRLLHAIENVALKKRLQLIWGWVLENNTLAQRAFEKCGFIRQQEVSERFHNGEIKQGYIYKKNLNIPI